MSKYLIDKFVGKYRVKAEYDHDTNDLPRLENGAIDPDYDDYYIPCRSNMVLKHGVGANLWVYSPSSGVIRNVIRDYYAKIYSHKLQDVEKCISQLVNDGYLVSGEILDGEGYIEFNIKWLDDLAPFIKPSTYGAKIHPHSKRNHKKIKYVIPEDDEKKYKNIIQNVPPLQLGRFAAEFGKKMWGDKFNELVTQSNLTPKNFIHNEGKWSDYLDYLRKKVSNG